MNSVNHIFTTFRSYFEVRNLENKAFIVYEIGPEMSHFISNILTEFFFWIFPQNWKSIS